MPQVFKIGPWLVYGRRNSASAAITAKGALRHGISCDELLAAF